MKKYINLNVLLAEYFVKALFKLGVRDVVISPGSRSTPLVIAFSEMKNIRSHVVIDERSNGYMALGLAKSSGKPVAVVTTSGTAVAELYPAVIEAYHQRIPLVICSADRPERLVNTGANQTINQVDIYGNFTRHFSDSGDPKPTKKYFNQISREVSKGFSSLLLNPGPVHFNLRFDKPLEKFASTHLLESKFISFVRALKLVAGRIQNQQCVTDETGRIGNLIRSSRRILIMAGPANLTSKEAKEIVSISRRLNAPIIADGLSGLRMSGITRADILFNATAFIRNRNFLSTFDPDLIIQFGDAPTSNILLRFFNDSKSVKVLFNKLGDVKDPSRTYKYLVKQTPGEFLSLLKQRKIAADNPDKVWSNSLLDLNEKAQVLKEDIIERSLLRCEAGLVKTLLDSIPEGSNLMLSNSIVPRDVDYFSNIYDKKIAIYHNRGASGIDGIISTAAGIQAASGSRTYLLTGDLAFMHDLNGLWLLKKYEIPLTIILVNNNGGSIFEMLPVYKENIDFEKYFKVPTESDFKKLTQSFKGGYALIRSKSQLAGLISNENSGFRVLEIRTDSQYSLGIRKKYWNKVIQETQKVIDEYSHR